MIKEDILESAILEELAQVGACSIEELNERLPYYSWDQVSSVVDRLMLQGTITMKHLGSSRYFLSLSHSTSISANPFSRSISLFPQQGVDKPLE
ncbi:MAG TPA: hypothetical protein VJU02_08025 [Nitrospiraceae bacterium]|nr:hypothetical protein [Nitrospiraceae bacterium]